MNENFSDTEYRQRIGLVEDVHVDETSFEAMHRAQVFTVPFENLDIHLGRGIDVSPGAVYRKVVKGKRGGYCFELNGLFLQALQHYGFEARALLARVHLTGTPGGRTHQISLVKLGNRQWIADVGFGAASLHAPIPLEMNRVSHQDGLEYRLMPASPWGTMLQLRMEGEWKDLYSFDREHVCQGDIETGNHFTSTSPRVHFTKVKIVSLVSPTGRVALSDQVLTRVEKGETTQEEWPLDSRYIGRIETRFGIELDAGIEDFQLES